MHRHGYQGRKLHRDSAQRKALMRGLSISLIEHGAIETTLPRAKELVPFIEPIITKAKKGDLASRRNVLSALNNLLVIPALTLQETAKALIKNTAPYLSAILAPDLIRRKTLYH